jgi:hypothetical protein
LPEHVERDIDCTARCRMDGLDVRADIFCGHYRRDDTRAERVDQAGGSVHTSRIRTSRRAHEAVAVILFGAMSALLARNWSKTQPVPSQSAPRGFMVLGGDVAR